MPVARHLRKPRLPRTLRPGARLSVTPPAHTDGVNLPGWPPSAPAVLAELHATRNKWSVSELAVRTGVSQPQVRAVVTRLVADGHAYHLLGTFKDRGTARVYWLSPSGRRWVGSYLTAAEVS